MADYLAKGDKTVYCRHGHANVVPFQQTLCTCSTCECKFTVRFFGVVIDKHGNYAPYHNR